MLGDDKGMSPEGKQTTEDLYKAQPGSKHEQAVRFCEGLTRRGMTDRTSAMLTFLTIETEKLEAATKENRKLIDAMLESQQIAAKVRTNRIDHLENRIMTLVKFETRCETNRTEYIAHLENRIGNLEARAH